MQTLVHPQRREDPVMEKLGEGLTGYPCHDFGKQQVAGVAVFLALACRKVCAALAQDQIERPRLRNGR